MFIWFWLWILPKVIAKNERNIKAMRDDPDSDARTVALLENSLASMKDVLSRLTRKEAA